MSVAVGAKTLDLLPANMWCNEVNTQPLTHRTPKNTFGFASGSFLRVAEFSREQQSTHAPAVNVPHTTCDTLLLFIRGDLDKGMHMLRTHTHTHVYKLQSAATIGKRTIGVGFEFGYNVHRQNQFRYKTYVPPNVHSPLFNCTTDANLSLHKRSVFVWVLKWGVWKWLVFMAQNGASSGPERDCISICFGAGQSNAALSHERCFVSGSQKAHL